MLYDMLEQFKEKYENNWILKRSLSSEIFEIKSVILYKDCKVQNILQYFDNIQIYIEFL